MATLLKRGADNLMNGTILGAITGALIVYGQNVYNWIVPIIPQSWIDVFPEGIGIAVILIGIGALVGYLVDRN